MTAVQVTHQAPHVYTVGFNTTTSFLRIDKTSVASGQNIGTNTKDDMSLGAYTDGTFPSYALVREVLVYNRLLDTNEIQQVENWLYDGLRNSRANIVFDGDSHTRGYTASTHWGDYPYQTIIGLTNKSVLWHNRGVPSQTSAQMLSTVSDVDNLYSALASTNIIVVSIGANDLATGVTLDTLKTNVINYINGRRTAGFQCVITVGIPPHAVVSNYTESNWNNYLDWLDNTANTGADANVDIRDNTDIGQWGDNTNATYYGTDNVHMKDAGNLALANLVLQVLGPFIP
jgi:lysophospholipase L1-like esterase